MSNRLRVTLFVFVIISVLAISAKPVEALPFDVEETNVWIDASDFYEKHYTFNTGDIVSGYLETDDTSMILYFFICDSANFTLWSEGSSASGYEIVEDVHTHYFDFDIPYDDTWYLVYSNDDISNGVYVDIAIDTEGDDNTPRYSSSSYYTTGYGEVLENDEWWHVWIDLDAGDEISGHFSTFFTTDGVDFFICDDANYDLWSTGSTASVYGSQDDMHQASISAFTVPSDDTWHLVFSAVGESDAVTLSYGIDIDFTTGATTTTDPTTSDPPPTDGTSMIGIAGIGFIGLIALLAICVCINKRKKGAPPTQPFDSRGYPPSGPTGDWQE